ncbi:MAG TPA: YqaE/Pmp3 family membrane protein [Vitreimonas sp.]|nr:YqaE/Pmp3 family membrane protein [Vitreimonas sp.]
MNIIIKVILAFVFPPLAALMEVGLSFHFVLNVVLTLFGWLPGALHALWLVYSANNSGNYSDPVTL